MHDHCQAFEACLRVLVPQLVADLNDAIWERHQRAYLRLPQFLDVDAAVSAFHVVAAGLVYAIATTPYLTLPSGRGTQMRGAAT